MTRPGRPREHRRHEGLGAVDHPQRFTASVRAQASAGPKTPEAGPMRRCSSGRRRRPSVRRPPAPAPAPGRNRRRRSPPPSPPPHRRAPQRRCVPPPRPAARARGRRYRRGARRGEAACGGEADARGAAGRPRRRRRGPGWGIGVSLVLRWPGSPPPSPRPGRVGDRLDRLAERNAARDQASTATRPLAMNSASRSG